MFRGISIQLHNNKRPVKIHLVSTGGVAVKTKFRENKHSGLIAMIDFILDKNFTEWLPIWIMIIEHPEGIFVIDAGEVSDVNRPGYFKSSGAIAHWFDKTQFKFAVQREEEIDRQLQRLNIPVEKVRTIVLTHLHFDHTDGIKHFPNTEILVNKAEWEKPFGDLPKLYPSWFKPKLIELGEQFEVFDKAQYLTEAKDIIIVETPGHTYHHCSVLVKADACYIFFAADICYSQPQLSDAKFPGNNASNKLAKETYGKVNAFAKNHPIVFIPSHDIYAAERLKELRTMF
jgi:N-acyl homoserine lactone hydrolase